MELENNIENNKFLIKPSSQIYYITAILKKYGYKQGNKVDFAESIGKLDLIKLLIQLGEKSTKDVQKYLHSLGYKGVEDAINYAAENGYFHTVKYLQSIGYECYEWIIHDAARNGHLEVVKYLHELGYRGTEYAINCAAENGHIEVVKYLIELGYECDKWIINDAERKGKNAEQLLKVLIDLHSIGYKSTEKAIFHAKLAGYLEAFEYLHSIGYRYS